MLDDPRYVPVAQALPEVLPALTRKDAIRYAKKLVRHFGRVGLGSPNQTRPASLADWGLSAGRRVWISTAPTAASDHHKGWGRLIHDVSHLVFARRHPTFRPHDGGHAALEREMAAYVARKGWLAPKEPKPVVDRREARRKRLALRLKKWLTREKRAHTAIRKLRRQLARLDRQ